VLTYFSGQYDAWCRNNGNYATLNREAENWNAKIIWKMRSELDFQWTLVEDEVAVVFSKLSDDIKSILKDIRDAVERVSAPICPSSHNRVTDDAPPDRFAFI
jgi:hypothetical protein